MPPATRGKPNETNQPKTTPTSDRPTQPGRQPFGIHPDVNRKGRKQHSAVQVCRRSYNRNVCKGDA